MFYESSHIAIVTGKISGITVIDLDGTAEQDLLKQGYKLPNTPTVKTQSGGKHLYFKYNPALKTDSKINEQKNIDIRNDGGYVVAYGDGYEWIKHIHNTPLQEVPRFFIEMYESHKKGNKKSLANGGSKGAEIEQSERDRKSTRLNSSHVGMSYARFCLKKEPGTVSTGHMGADRERAF